MCVCVCTPTKTLRKKVTSKFQTTLPHIHIRKNRKNSHTLTEEKKPLMKTKTTPTQTQR